MKVSTIELKTSVNTDAIAEDTIYMDAQGECIQNTGITLPGEAVTNQYVEDLTYSDANLEEVYINSKGQVYKSFNNQTITQAVDITVDGNLIGSVWKAGVKNNSKLTGYNDYVLTSTGTILALTNTKITELQLINDVLTVINSKASPSVILQSSISRFIYRVDITYSSITASDIYSISNTGESSFGNTHNIIPYNNTINTYKVPGQDRILICWNINNPSSTSLNTFYVYAVQASVLSNITYSNVITNAVGWMEYNFSGYCRVVWYKLSGWAYLASTVLGQTIGQTALTSTYTETPADITMLANATFGTPTGITISTWGIKYIELNIKNANFRGKILITKRTDGNLSYVIIGDSSTSGTPPATAYSYNIDGYYAEANDICVATNSGQAVGLTIGDVSATSYINTIGEYDQSANLWCITTSQNINRYILYKTTDGYFRFILIDTPSKRFLNDYQVNTCYYSNILDYTNRKLAIGNMAWAGASIIRVSSGSLIAGTDYVAFSAQSQDVNYPIASTDYGYKTFTGSNILTTGGKIEILTGMDGLSYPGVNFNVYLTTNTNNILYKSGTTNQLITGGGLFNNTSGYCKIGVNSNTFPSTIFLGASVPIPILQPPATNPIYIQTTDLPNPLNNEGYDGITYFYNLPFKSTYQIANYVQAELMTFLLFSQTYGYDGNFIYLINFTNQTGEYRNFQSMTKLCNARGLTYIDASPTEAYFYSSFDNSLYTFNGGRSCDKIKGLSGFDSIIGGIYNVRDNTLMIETTTKLLWLRNGIWTYNTKTGSQTNLRYYSTANGIYLKSGLRTWRYGYEPIGSVLTLVYQTKFYGLPNNQTCQITDWIFRVYDPAKSGHTLTLTNYVNDSTGQYIQTVDVSIIPADYSSSGYAYVRLQPQRSLCLSASLKIECQDKIFLIDMTVKYNENAYTTVPEDRSV